MELLINENLVQELEDKAEDYLKEGSLLDDYQQATFRQRVKYICSLLSICSDGDKANYKELLILRIKLLKVMLFNELIRKNSIDINEFDIDLDLYYFLCTLCSVDATDE